MTISVKVSVNGNYKIPVVIDRNNTGPVTEVISGRGFSGPNVKDIPVYGKDVVSITIGPEEEDKGENL